MNTFVQVPVLETNVPPFLFNRNMTSYIHKFIDWCAVEYVTAVHHYETNGNRRQLELVKRHFNPVIIASTRKEFKNICRMMTTDVWNSLSREERRFITETYNFISSQKRRPQ